jgi:hypothetical protein
VLSVTSATLAVAAHTAAGGEVPDTALVLLLVVGVAAVGVALADRRRSTPAILVVLGIAQLVSHLLLSLGMPAMASETNDLTMLGAHVVAVLVSGALLARADAAIFRFAAVLAMLLPRLLVAPPVAESVVLARPSALCRVTAMSVLLRRSHGRRGPPVSA